MSVIENIKSLIAIPTIVDNIDPDEAESFLYHLRKEAVYRIVELTDNAIINNYECSDYDKNIIASIFDNPAMEDEWDCDYCVTVRNVLGRPHPDSDLEDDGDDDFHDE